MQFTSLRLELSDRERCFRYFMDNASVLCTENKKIRPVIYVFVVFEMMMLVQTSHSNLGTIVTAILCGLMVFTFFIESHTVKSNLSNCTIFFYAIVLVAISAFTSSISSRLFQFIIYAGIFVLLTSLSLSKREKNLILIGFVLTSIVYSILIIFYKVTNPTMYIHSKIIILGSELDPNYIGLPLIVAFSILLYDTMNRKMKAVKILALVIMAFAILLTSSRGNFLSLAICVFGNVVHFFNNIDVKIYKKALILITLILVIYIFYDFVSDNYAPYLQRILDFSGEDIGNGRSVLWSEAIELWWDRPIFGNGFEALGKFTNKGAHNTYIQVLCDSGIVGFLLFSIFLLNLLRNCFRFDKCLFIGMLGLICHSFFLGAISSRCFWAVLIMTGMALTNSKLEKEQT